MKILFLLLLLTSCAQSYQTYNTIDKRNFSKDGENSHVTPKLVRSQKVEHGHCEGQVLFFSNARAQTDKYIDRMVTNLCGDSDFLLDSKLTETWWTTIIYTRSCVKFETYCPRVISR